MIKVLFVCTGNICRSPTAEGVFRHLAGKAGIAGNFRIDSAGVSSSHTGEPPDARAIRTAKKYGVSLAGQTARNMTPADFSSFDYIYAMDGSHMRIMQGRQPCGSAGSLRMFLEKGDVPDPWYGDEEDFEHAYALINDGCTRILAQIRKDHGL